MLTIACVCFIGKNSKPLFFRHYSTTLSETSLQLATYAALDALEAACLDHVEGGGPPGGSPPPDNTPSDPYKGYLGPAVGVPSLVTLAHQCASSPQQQQQQRLTVPKDLACFGYAASSGLKIILVVEEMSTFTDPDLRPIFRQLHQGYANALCNPFAVEDLASAAGFADTVDSVITNSVRLFA